MGPEFSKHIPEVRNMYKCVFSLKVSGGSWGSVMPVSKLAAMSVVDESFFQTLRVSLSCAT